MVGLLLSSPIFAEAAKHAKAFRLIGYGLAIWGVAVAGCGFSLGFFSLLVCRMAVGVGEASFVALASPFIDDNAPAEKKTRWLATFYLCIPCGFALGFLYGGAAAPLLGWRVAFFLEAVAVLPFVFICFSAPPMDLRGTTHEVEGGAVLQEAAALNHHHHHNHHNHHHQNVIFERLQEAWRDILQLYKRPFYLWIVAGMTFYTAVISTLSFWGPQAARSLFDMDPTAVDLTFGGITVVTGVVGTLSGGVLLDLWGSTLRNGALLCALGLAVAAVLLLSSFALSGTFLQFCVLFSLGECAMFATMAPSNAVAMWSVPQGLRPLAMSMSVVAMHVFGDVPTPPLIGILQGKVDNWRVTMCVLAAGLAVGAVAYCGSVFAAATAIDFRGEDDAGGGGGGGEDVTDNGVVVVVDLEEEAGGGDDEGRKKPEDALLEEYRNDDGTSSSSSTLPLPLAV